MIRGDSSRIAFASTLAAFLALGVLTPFAWPLNWDAAWLLEMASQFLDGGRLYVDVVEVNPPLIVWLSTIPVGIARATGWSGPVSFFLCVLALFGISFWMNVRVLRAAWADEPDVRRSTLVLLPLALLVLPMINFGEREHLLMLLAVPYLLLGAARIRPDVESNSVIDAGSAAVIGAMAGVGVALKPYFVLLPLFVELWVLARLGRHPWMKRVELRVGVGFLSLYAALVPLITPEYLDVVRLALGGYGAFDVPLADVVLRGEIALVCGACLAAWSLRSRLATRSLGSILAVASIALAAVAIVQGKGWGYHFYPALCSSTLLLGLGILQLTSRSLDERRARAVRALLGGALVVGVSALLVPRALDPDDHPVHRLADVVEREAGGGSVMVFSTQIGVAFPMVNYAKVDWASRFPHLWFLPGFYPERRPDGGFDYRSPDEQSESERRLFDAVIEDFLAHEPKLVLVVRDVPEPGFPQGDFDYLAYYSQDPRFAREFERYDRLEEVWPTVIYERR